jgi:hypothetical protein
MKNTDNLPSAQRLRELLAYDPDTGILTWKRRRNLHPKDRFNLKYAGSVAGCVAPGMGRRQPYIKVRIDNRLQQAHRVIWCMAHGVWPTQPIDHINGVGTDNRLVNLRVVSHQENSRNRPMNRNNSSGVVGVHWDSGRECWVASLKSGYSKVLQKRFDSFLDAVAARKSAENSHGFHPNHGRTAG